MLEQLRPFFDHSRHTLDVRGVAAPLDVLAFDGDEGLSRTFAYRIEFTCASPDLTADALLGKDATFTLHPPPADLPMRGYIPPVQPPLRALHGVVSHFKRLSGSRDETRYEVLLEPRLALLERSRQYRIYQNQSVPEIVEQVLRNHGFRGQDFLFELTRTYLQREQVMQYGESDLAFIQRLLAEIGIWYGFSMDARLKIDVVQFHDDQRHYLPAPSLSLRPLSGLASGNQDGVWNLQTRHEVVQQQVSNRAYYYRAASAPLDAAADLARSPQTTYGEAYHYGEPHQTEGDAYARGDEEGHAESGHFYARLAHERYLNQRTQLSGTTSSAELLPGHLLNIDGAPQAFAPGAVIVRQHCRAARDRSFEAHFEAIPYSEQVCFRPMVPAKPVIAGSLPARVTSPQQNDPYGHIDNEGRYRVNFLFDRDAWDAGRESMWLRLARPYAGDTHGLHLPLLAGTEVAIAFEQGDPDRPYIAHALHDNLHPDHVTLQNYKRNVLRTPANNKLRLDDTRGQEHIKLSTEQSGKSQLNLGHLVDAQKQKRGEGFELRTDGHGAIRAGKGLFISADAQPQAQGQVLEMKAALVELQESLEQVRNMARDAALAMAQEPDKLAPEQLKAALDLLQQPGILASAPDGIALTSGEHLQLAAQNNLILNAGNQADISVVKRLFIGAGEGLGLFVRKLGMKLIANQGAVRIQAQNERMELQARKALNIVSTEGEIHITAKRKITFNAGGSYIRIDPYGIEYGTQGDYRIKAKYWGYLKTKAMQQPTLPALPLVLPEHPNSLALNLRDASAQAVAGAPYAITFETGQVLTGILNEHGHALHSPVPDSGARVQYQLPPPGPEQTWPPYEQLLEAIAQVGPDTPR